MGGKLFRILATSTIAAALALSSIPAIAQSTSARGVDVTAFDAPFAGTASDQGTFAVGNNDFGAITGFVRDPNFVRRGFVRRPNGRFITFDSPGGGNCSTPCPDIAPGTRAYGINNSGVIAGHISDLKGIFHGFVRAASGAITTFDVPGAGSTSLDEGTYSTGSAYTINDSGAITGYTLDFSLGQHGFVRAPNGSVVTFDPVNSGGTAPYAIDSAGSVTGIYCDTGRSPAMIRGFFRKANGAITVFDAPGAGSDDCFLAGTFPTGTEASGVIEGSYADASGMNRGFLRARNGSFRSFDVPGAGTASSQGTFTTGNNRVGVIIGFFVDSGNATHGFIRRPSGKVIEFDGPGSQGTIPQGVNDRVMVAGYFVDGGNVIHGFLVAGSSEEDSRTVAPTVSGHSAMVHGQSTARLLKPS